MSKLRSDVELVSDELKYLIRESKMNSSEILNKKIRKITPDKKFEEVILKYYMKQIAADGLDTDTQNESKLYFK